MNKAIRVVSFVWVIFTVAVLFGVAATLSLRVKEEKAQSQSRIGGSEGPTKSE